MSWGCVLSELWVGTKTSLLLKLCTFAASARRIPHDQDAGRQPRMIDLEVSAKCVGGYVQESLIDAASVTMYSNPIQSAISRNLIGQIFGTELGYIVKCPHYPLRETMVHISHAGVPILLWVFGGDKWSRRCMRAEITRRSGLSGDRAKLVDAFEPGMGH